MSVRHLITYGAVFTMDALPNCPEGDKELASGSLVVMKVSLDGMVTMLKWKQSDRSVGDAVVIPYERLRVMIIDGIYRHLGPVRDLEECIARKRALDADQRAGLEGFDLGLSS